MDVNQSDKVKCEAAKILGINDSEITGYQIKRKTLDARSKQPVYLLSLELFIGEPIRVKSVKVPHYRDVHQSDRQVIIAGCGPTGLFAALKLLENGVKPIILERGKLIRDRRRDIANLNKKGIIDPNSNYCFGEGGAGTYSDGKLFTRSIKRGNVNEVLGIFNHFGADDNILYESHPHIGTNKLPAIISSMRELIQDAGGVIHFDSRIQDIHIQENAICGVWTSDGEYYPVKKLILCTGHSARDIFQLLHSSKILIKEKPFALGIRVEHPQNLVDRMQYHSETRDPFLPPASYSLVQQVGGQSVFSFCMCPGGIIAPASTDPEALVINGWSPSKRNNPYANSGIVMQVGPKDWQGHLSYGALAAMQFQKELEQRAYKAGGGNFTAPALRMTDFVEGKVSTTLPACSYPPGLNATDFREVLPPGILKCLKHALLAFNRKMKGFYTQEAVVVALESRTSSPVWIPRDENTMEHIQIQGLYPCGEGAGYAGGIMSAAMDGQRTAEALIRSFGHS